MIQIKHIRSFHPIISATFQNQQCDIHAKLTDWLVGHVDIISHIGVTFCYNMDFATPSLRHMCSIIKTMCLTVAVITCSLTTIHTWAHLTLETHMKASWVNPQVALKSETQSSHVSLTTLQGHSHTEFKSLQLPPVRTEEASWMRGWNDFKKLKQVQLPTILHLELPLPGWLGTLFNNT